MFASSEAKPSDASGLSIQPPGDAVEVPSVDDLQETVRCPVCCEEIRRGAKLCIHCKSDFTWRRFMPVGATTFAMLAALVAVVGAVAPQLQRLFDTSDSVLAAVVVGASQDKSTLTILVTNEGTKKGIVLDVDVLVPYPDAANAKATAILSADPIAGSPVTIDAKATQQLQLKWRRTWMVGESQLSEAFRGETSRSISWFANVETGPRKCMLVLKVVNASGKHDQRFTHFECVHIYPHILEVIERPSKLVMPVIPR